MAQLAALANRSERVAAQGKTAEDVRRSPLIVAQQAVAAGINRSTPSFPQLKPAGLAAQLKGSHPANPSGLPDKLKAGIESLSGISLDNVKVHYNSSRPSQLNALAYTQGTDIHLAPGQAKHLPHEAWHVVQQAQGRVQPTAQMKAGVPINDDERLEREADMMGEQALQMRSLAAAAVGGLSAVDPRPLLQFNGKKKGAPQEQIWADKVKEHGFESVKVGGSGTQGADITAQDAERLWFFEVKGGNNWLSADNKAHEGNVPAKQLSEKLLSALTKTIKVKNQSDQTETVTVADVFHNPDYYAEARSQLLLGASNLDVADALLAFRYLPGKEDAQGSFKKEKAATVPLTLTDVLNRLRSIKFNKPDDQKEFESNFQRDVKEIDEAWGEWQEDGRSFFVQNPGYLITLEGAYTFACQHESDEQERLAALKEGEEFRFLPVVKDLQHVEKPVQKRAAGTKPTMLQLKASQPIQLRKFKGPEEAEEYLSQRLRADLTDSWEDITALLEDDLAAEDDLATNYNRLYEAYGRLTRGVEINDLVEARRRPAQNLPDAIWRHIAFGEVKENKVVGYHWKGLGAESAVEAFGEQAPADRWGAYRQSVRERNQRNPSKPKIVKAEQSSFFPDNWSAEEVKMAIQYAKREGKDQIYTVTLPAKGQGMVLFFNGDSYFPYLK